MYQDRNKISHPGEYNLDECTLISYNGYSLDLRENILEIVVHESIDNLVSGQLVLAENVNLLKYVPIIGNEYLRVNFSTPGRSKRVKGDFFVYKVNNKLELDENNKMSVYTLNFVSVPFVLSRDMISRSFKNMPYSDMAASICSTDLKITKPLVSQPTLGMKNIVLPYMYPIDAIRWLATKSISKEEQSCSYLFYETIDEYRFCDVNYKKKKDTETVPTYSYFKANLSVSGADFRNIEVDFYRIESYDVTSLNNTIQNLELGVFSSETLTHDMTTKSFKSTNFSYNFDYMTRSNAISKNGILPINNDKFSSMQKTNFKFYPKQSYMYDGVVDNDEYENTVPHRSAHLHHFKNSGLSILVAGDSSRRTGDIVQANIFSAEAMQKDSKNPYDPYLSGKYLVTKVTHILQKEVYKMRLSLERDSIGIGYPELNIAK